MNQNLRIISKPRNAISYGPSERWPNDKKRKRIFFIEYSSEEKEKEIENRTETGGNSSEGTTLVSPWGSI